MFVSTDSWMIFQYPPSSNKIGLGCVYYYSLMADEPRRLVHGLVCQVPRKLPRSALNLKVRHATVSLRSLRSFAQQRQLHNNDVPCMHPARHGRLICSRQRLTALVVRLLATCSWVRVMPAVSGWPVVALCGPLTGVVATRAGTAWLDYSPL